jgi:hypothetical protein
LQTRFGLIQPNLLARRPKKLAAVALANQMARIIWAKMMRARSAAGRIRNEPLTARPVGSGLAASRPPGMTMCGWSGTMLVGDRER